MTEFAVELRRTVAAPRDVVYRAFLEPETLRRWMCPHDSVVTGAAVEEHVGGRHVVEMLAPDGTRHAFESVIRDLVEGERIVLDFTFVRPTHPMREQTLLTVTVRDAGEGSTEVRLRQERVTHAPPMTEPSVNAGWTSVLDKLEALYEGS